jgi:hypothetical protein
MESVIKQMGRCLAAEPAHRQLHLPASSGIWQSEVKQDALVSVIDARSKPSLMGLMLRLYGESQVLDCHNLLRRMLFVARRVMTPKPPR